MMSLIIFLLSFIHGISATTKPISNDNFIPDGYNKHHAPSSRNNNQGLTSVLCGMTAITMIRLSPKEMDMKLEMAFYIGWKDKRLDLTNFKNSSAMYTIIGNDIAGKLWYPTLSFGNCKECGSSTLYKPVRDTLFFNHKRFEFYSWVRRVETFVCHFDMQNYPFDKHTCSIRIQAFKTQPLDLNYSVWQPNLSLINVPPEVEIYNFSTSNCPFDNETFSSCGSFDLSVARLRGRSVLLIFLPSILIVVMSWISFWFDPSNVAPRVALGITSMLTLSTQFSSAQRDLPAVSTTMALDLWMFFCLFMVFASLIEFSIVSVLMRQSNSTVSVTPLKPTRSNSKNANREQSATIVSFVKRNAKYIDKISRFLFPFIFISFNVYFWTKYTL